MTLDNNTPLYEDLADQVRELEAKALEQLGEQMAVGCDEDVVLCDNLLKEAKALERQIKDGKEAAWRPLKTAADEEAALWKSPTDSATSLKRRLLKGSEDYKRVLAAEAAKQAAAQRAAAEQAFQARDAEAAKELRKQAAKTEAQKPKGLRTRREPAIQDGQAALKHIAAKDPDALRSFILGYVRSRMSTLGHGVALIPGVIYREEKVAA